jgi:hypothetical protein
MKALTIIRQSRLYSQRRYLRRERVETKKEREEEKERKREREREREKESPIIFL